MRMPQIAGMAVMVAVVAGVELPVDWLVPLAMLCGGVAVFVVSFWTQSKS